MVTRLMSRTMLLAAMMLMMMEVTTTTATMMMMMMMCRIKDDEYDGGDGDNDVEDDDDDGDGYDSYDLLRLRPWKSTLHGHVGGCDGYLSGRKKMMPAVAPCPRLDSLN